LKRKFRKKKWGTSICKSVKAVKARRLEGCKAGRLGGVEESEQN
jgi:hypothetical protein